MESHDWNALGIDVPAEASSRALAILDHADCPKKMQIFYDPTTNYAGATFPTLAPNDPFNLEPSDLLAVTLMGVNVRAAGMRRLMDDGETRSEVVQALRQVPPDVQLGDASDEDLDAVAALYFKVHAALRGNKWVTASKIVARKRPALFPVRDSVVCAELDLTMQCVRDIAAFRHLMTVTEVMGALERVVTDARGLGADITDVPRLRLLDTAMWMHHIPLAPNPLDDEQGDEGRGS